MLEEASTPIGRLNPLAFIIMKKEKKITIKQDDREPNLQLMADINSIDIEFVRERLKVGDYVYEDIIIERKTIDDLAASILDKRIETQVEKMKKSKKDCYIIIVGNLKERKNDINENCILGKVVSLVVKHGMKVLWCEDDSQFLYVIKNLIDKSNVLKGGEKKK